ncbi:MAG: FaeA/PapI family transcriptional regulator [Methylotenera sp.]|nr:FaeA/PapI family transcriptional regulator [Methylotenera sp.]
MDNTQVLEYLKKHGQQTDRVIAKDIGISVDQVRSAIAALEQTKAVSSCNVTSYEDGVAVEGILCRISGYIPPAAPGRKAAPQPQ